MYVAYKTPEWKYQTLKRAKVLNTYVGNYFSTKGKISLRDLNQKDIKTFYDDIQNRYSESHCESLRLFLKNSFQYGISRGALLLNPVELVPVPSKRFRPVDDMRAHVQKVLSSKYKFSSEQSVLLTLFGIHKLGYKEITELVVSDINIHTQQIRLRRKKKFVGCNDELLKPLKKVLSERSLKIPTHDVVFMTEEKQPLKYYELMKMIVRWCNEAGI